MSSGVLRAERMHLAGLLEAIQRCVYFLNASGWIPRVSFDEFAACATRQEGVAP